MTTESKYVVQRMVSIEAEQEQSKQQAMKPIEVTLINRVHGYRIKSQLYCTTLTFCVGRRLAWELQQQRVFQPDKLLVQHQDQGFIL